MASAASAAARSRALPTSRQLKGDAPEGGGGIWENLTSLMQMVGNPQGAAAADPQVGLARLKSQCILRALLKSPLHFKGPIETTIGF